MTEWRESKLGDVITLKRGYDLPQQRRKIGPFPIVSSSGVTDHHIEAKVKGPGVVTGRYGTLGPSTYEAILLASYDAQGFRSLWNLRYRRADAVEVQVDFAIHDRTHALHQASGFVLAFANPDDFAHWGSWSDRKSPLVDDLIASV